MKKIVTAMLLCSTLALTGCDEEAQQYANQLGGVLNSYQAQVNRKINAEQEAYKNLVSLYAHAQEEDVRLRLALERNRRARTLADELVTGEQSAPTGSAIRALLLDYANHDFEQTRGLLEDESEASTRFLANLEELSVESKKIESLGKMFGELAKPKRPLRQLKEFVGFANGVDAGIQKLACDDAKRELADAKAEADKEKDDKLKKVLLEQVAHLESELDTKNCAAE